MQYNNLVKNNTGTVSHNAPYQYSSTRLSANFPPTIKEYNSSTISRGYPNQSTSRVYSNPSTSRVYSDPPRNYLNPNRINPNPTKVYPSPTTIPRNYPKIHPEMHPGIHPEIYQETHPGIYPRIHPGTDPGMTTRVYSKPGPPVNSFKKSVNSPWDARNTNYSEELWSKDVRNGSGGPGNNPGGDVGNNLRQGLRRSSMNTDIYTPVVFWIMDPSVLFQTFEIYPNDAMNDAARFNAMTRVIIIIAAIMFAVGFQFWWLFLVLGLLVVIVLWWVTKEREQMYNMAMRKQREYLRHPDSRLQQPRRQIIRPITSPPTPTQLPMNLVSR